MNGTAQKLKAGKFVQDLFGNDSLCRVWNMIVILVDKLRLEFGSFWHFGKVAADLFYFQFFRLFRFDIILDFSEFAFWNKY